MKGISGNLISKTKTNHTVIVLFSGRAPTSSSEALRFPGLAASRTGIFEGMMKVRR